MSGQAYTYGMVDGGFLMRLEHGTTWAGAGIKQVLKTADILPLSSTFEETLLRHLRVVLKRGSGSPAFLGVAHYGDGNPSPALIDFLSVTAGGSRLAGHLQPVNRTAISHQLHLEVTTTDQQVTWLLLSGWFERVRQRGR